MEGAVAVIEQELRRAVEHGFTESELEEMKAHALNAAEQAVKRAPTRQSAGIAMGLISSINDAIPTFFAIIWFHTPHLPVVAGPEYAAMYSQYDDFKKNYYGCVTAMDEQILVVLG